MFEQLSSSIAWWVMVVQSDGKKVVHMGPFKSRKNHVSCRALQSYNSPGDWAKELFKPSTDSASL